MNTTKIERRWMQKLKNIDCLYLPPVVPGEAAIEYSYWVYIEVDIDFNDVRTGYKSAVKLARALKIYSTHAVPVWSEEIILDARIGRIKETAPPGARLRRPPEFVDAEFINSIKNRFIENLTRTWKKILYRNSELNIYSGAGESREDFLIRCREQFSEQMRGELNRLRVVFNRMQEQLKEKYLGISEAEMPESAPVSPEASDRDIYARYAERIASLFLNAASDADIAEADMPRMEKKSELEERLIALIAEARRKIALLRESCEKKTECVDEYILRPNRKNINCERCGILWMPRKAG